MSEQTPESTEAANVPVPGSMDATPGAPPPSAPAEQVLPAFLETGVPGTSASPVTETSSPASVPGEVVIPAQLLDDPISSFAATNAALNRLRELVRTEFVKAQTIAMTDYGYTLEYVTLSIVEVCDILGMDLPQIPEEISGEQSH